MNELEQSFRSDDKSLMTPYTGEPHGRAVASYAKVEVSLQASSRRPAGTTPRARWSSRWLAKWHLLSLDAPTVATLWTAFIAHAEHIRLPWTDLVAMFVAVWMLYAADRMMDAQVLDENPQARGLEARHLFHHVHSDFFRWFLVMGFVLLVCLVSVMVRFEVRLFLVLGVLLGGWFLLIHRGEKPLPKELVVGVFFAAATAVPTLSRLSTPWFALLLPALVFGAACSLNCLFIFRWEIEHGSSAAGHVSAFLFARFLPQLGVVLIGAALVLLPFVGGPARWMMTAAIAAIALLMVLHTLRDRVSHTTLRAMADFVLLTPLLLWMWVH